MCSSLNLSDIVLSMNPTWIYTTNLYPMTGFGSGGDEPSHCGQLGVG